MRVLVGTLHCGENEFGQCLDSLRRQQHRDWEHFVLEGLPEKEAHDRLYGRFMERSGDFDLFLKLDADMVLCGADRLGAAVRLFEGDACLDHAVFRVHDWMSRTPIIGIHMYRSRVRWTRHDDLLHPDLAPVIDGRRRYVLRRYPSPLALHCPDPSPLQAFHYGLHRGLKAFQIRVRKRRRFWAVWEWRLLRRVWRHFDETRDRRPGLALMAVEHVLAEPVGPEDCNYTGTRLREVFARYEPLSAADMHDRLRATWGGAVRRETRWLRALLGAAT